jgi:hypothetical protein
MDVLFVLCEIVDVADPVVDIATLPDFSMHLKALAGAVRKTSFYELDSVFESNAGSRGEEYVKVIRHDCEFVQEVLPLATVVEQGFY